MSERAQGSDLERDVAHRSVVARPRLWDTCKASWTEYLEDEDGPRRLQIIAAMHNHQRNLFAITHRAIGRTRWQMALNEVLRDLPRVRTTDPFGNEEVRHHSTLIRRIAPDHDLVGSMFQASDIFVVRFLRTIGEGSSLDFGLADWVVDAVAAGEDDPDNGDEGSGNG